MKLTIEKAKNHKCPSPALCCASNGFIEGWNQAIDNSVKIILGSVSSESGHLLCNKNPYQLAEEINKLKVRGEK